VEQKNHCHFCGKPLTQRFVEGRQRLYCPACNRPIYENPIPATCMVVVNAADQVLLVKRSIDPKKGQWCLPGGFIELGEPPDAGALRELAEETGLSGKIKTLLGVCTTPSSQYHSVLMVGYLIAEHHGRLTAGDDASDVRWFCFDELPPIAFDSHRCFVDQYLRGIGQIVESSNR
jgi:8-oxo-dGTP diphosphatase